jgi:hypothetical protein
MRCPYTVSKRAVEVAIRPAIARVAFGFPLRVVDLANAGGAPANQQRSLMSARAQRRSLRLQRVRLLACLQRHLPVRGSRMPLSPVGRILAEPGGIFVVPR